MNKALIIILLCAISFPGWSQALEIRETQEKINGNLENSLAFTVNEGDKNLFEKEWKKLMRSYKGKSERGPGTIFVNPDIPGLNSDTLVVYALVHTKNQGVEFIAAFEVRDGFVSRATHPDKYKMAEKLLYDFAIETLKEVIRAQIQEQEKELASQERELKNLEKEKGNLEDDILRFEKAIEQAKADIEMNLKDQKAMQEAIKKQHEIIKATEKKLKEVK